MRSSIAGKFNLVIALGGAVASCLLSLPAHAQTEFRFERMWPTLEQAWHFDEPVYMAVDSSGNVYIVDWGNDQIQKLDSHGNFLTKWGFRGNDAGQFSLAMGIAVDASDNVYVVDFGNHRIQKFDSNGTFLTMWGSEGTGDGQFRRPLGIATDDSGNVYVSEWVGNRVQKFDSNGTFLTKWGSTGSGDGQFISPLGVATDSSGNVYITEGYTGTGEFGSQRVQHLEAASVIGNHRVQKFDSNGSFLTKWGSYGNGDGQFTAPLGVAVDGSGNVYVSDSYNYRIQSFDSNGNFLAQFGEQGPQDGEFSGDDGIEEFWGPWGVVVDRSDNILVAEPSQDRIQQFDSIGTFQTKWGRTGANEGQLSLPSDVAVDASGNVYVADANNHRIQKFDSNGNFLTQWGTFGSSPGQFDEPWSVAVDSSGNVYVTDRAQWLAAVQPQRIQKFDSDGNWLLEWGGTIGTGPGEFGASWGVAIGESGNVYVVDTGNHRIQVFDSDGIYLFEWGTFGSAAGKFNEPKHLAVDSSFNVYVIDYNNKRVQKFDFSGNYVTQWDTQGGGAGYFDFTFGIAIGPSDNVYVANPERIQIFDSDGTSLTPWGNAGDGAGEFRFLQGLTLDSAGNLYTADIDAHRIQKLTPLSIASNAKAIVVAAGGPFPGNTLWDATQYSANFAYRSLAFQGFTKDRIQYLSADTDLDLDGNGLPDDVDGDATNANLQAALETWASDADNLVVYLVDHGGADKFRMSGTENLLASELAQWVQTADNNISGTITFVYDACQSGSFLSALGGPGRIVVTSAAGSENAYFLSQGTISFSNFFWEQVFNGFSVLDAFDLAEQAMAAYQTPQLDDNGNGVANEPGDGTLATTTFIGNATDFNLTRPTIGGPVGVVEGAVIPSGSTATIFADNVTDAEGSIARVWAVFRPPNFVPPSSDNPISGFPTVDLLPVGGDRFEGVFDGFTEAGTYQIVIYALDANTETSLPLITSLSVDNPLKHKAIIAIGADPADPEWPVIQEAARLAYETLLFQQYTDAEIRFYSPVTFSAGVDGTLTQANLDFAINTWARDQGFDLVVYMVGTGGDTGTFRLNSSQTLSASTLDGWLDTLQASIPGRVTVLYDGSKSGSFATTLTPPVDKERIFIGSTDASQAVNFLLDGEVSFSRFFWRQVLNGGDVGDAFAHATQAMSFVAGGQTGTLDDNANGVVNEKSDGAIARRHRIGTGIILAGDDPLIGSDDGDVVVGASTFATFGVNDVTTTGTLDRVWAVISPPFFSDTCPHLLASVDLVSIGNDDYEGSFSGFTEQGDYAVAVFAQDDEGVISLPQEIIVNQPSSAFSEADSATQLRDNFESLDSDDSGGLTLAEARAQIPGLTAAVFNQLDDDSNGELTLAELIDGSAGVPGIQDPVYVDFSYNQFECGSYLQPFNTLGEGAAFVQAGGTLYLSGGNSPETLTIATPMTLAAISAVTIGAP